MIFPTKLPLKGLILLIVWGGVSPYAQAATSLDQVLSGFSRQNTTGAGSSGGGGGQTIQFQGLINENAWLQRFHDNVISNEYLTEDKRAQTQQIYDQAVKLDQECAAMQEGAGREACEQQRDAAVATLEKMVADENPDYEILLSQKAREAGDFTDVLDRGTAMNDFDQNAAQELNLIDTEGTLAGVPQTPSQSELQTGLPPAPTTDITHIVNDVENLEQQNLSQPNLVPVSPDQTEGFFDKIQNFWQRIRPGVEQAFFLQAVASSPFSSMGQSGQSQLRVINLNRSTDEFATAARQVSDQRAMAITRHNDIAGQSLAALQERSQQVMGTLDEITQEQDQALQALETICQNHRAQVQCWETGNEIPFDLLALLMGLTGGGGGDTSSPDLTLEPYTVWLHCPLPNQPFIITSEGVTFTGLLLEERSRLVLTLESALPNPLHPDGCIVGLGSEGGMQYFTALVQPEILDPENSVQADLVLLEIQQVHQELGEDMADPETPFDDFMNEYWPEFLSAQCQRDPVFALGDKLTLTGFEMMDSEASEPEEVVVLNGLSTFIAEQDGSTLFSTNGEESFHGGPVARKENGCFKGLAHIEIDVEEETNTQTLIPLSLIQAWLETQNITLPAPQNEGSDR